ncbi:MAG: hypothetical protein Q8P67_27000, partial [archaeon]|nr:hypothetical protein [archaeon]
ECYLPGTYAPTMVGARVNQQVFEILLAEHLPAVAEHIRVLNPPIGVVCILPWFMCLFVGFLPMEDTYKLLDNLLLEGPSVLFKVALALFKLKETEILETEEGFDIIQLFHPPLPFNWEMISPVAFSLFESLDDERVKQLANCSKLRVVRDLSEEAVRNHKWQRAKDAASATGEGQRPLVVEYPNPLNELLRVRDSLLDGIRQTAHQQRKALKKARKAKEKEMEKLRRQRKKKHKQKKYGSTSTRIYGATYSFAQSSVMLPSELGFGSIKAKKTKKRPALGASLTDLGDWGTISLEKNPPVDVKDTVTTDVPPTPQIPKRE